MTEYFQARKSDPPVLFVPSEFPKHMYGGNPVADDAALKLALESKLIKSKLVATQEEQDRLTAKGWVVDLNELIEESGPTITRDVEGEPDFELVIHKRRKRDAAPVSDDPEVVNSGKTPSKRSQPK